MQVLAAFGFRNRIVQCWMQKGTAKQEYTLGHNGDIIANKLRKNVKSYETC